MVADVSPVHFSNAYLPILVTELGMVIDVSHEQPENARSAIDVTEYVVPKDATVDGMFTTPALLLFATSQVFWYLDKML